MALISKCVCGSTSFESIELAYLPCRVCTQCKMAHQTVEMTPAEYLKYYTDQYPERRDVAYGQNHQHKKTVAKKRFDNYALAKGARLLDIGTGDGAFVDVCRDAGIDAWGCEIAMGEVSTKYCYPKDLRDCHFPTEHFDVVTMHDVLEHMIDPVGELKEMFRILKPGGQLLVEIPHFWGSEEESAHHYKPIEHLWFFREGHVADLARIEGFAPVGTSHPIPSKVLLDFARPAVKRTTILVPPGIGDSYWSLVKMRSFCGALGVGIPDVLISSLDKNKDRSVDYIRRVPFVNAAGYLRHKGSESWRPTWSEAYMRNGRSVFKNVEGCDYFLAYNGVLRHGRELEKVDGYVSDWLFPLWESLPETWYGESMKSKFGRYICAYFVPHGMYRHWLQHMPPRTIIDFLKTLAKDADARIVLVGGKWDVNTDLHHELQRALPTSICTDMTGKTTLEECFGMMRRAVGMVGFPSGITMMATTFRVPTVMFWNDYFPEAFWWNACPPESRNTWYHALDTKTPSSIRRALQLLGVPGHHFKSPAPKPPPPPRIVLPHKKLTVACVLRSGGDFDADYVARLRSMVDRHTTIPHAFVCLSDVAVPVDREPLRGNYLGWWSKLELFQYPLFDGPVVYFDLDTLIVGDLNPLFEKAPSLSFAMLQSFRRRGQFASGVMAWNGNYSRVLESFQHAHAKAAKYAPGHKAHVRLPHGDQEFILERIRHAYGMEPQKLNRFIGVASYKRHCLAHGGPPPNTSIVCFHGRPRPRDVSDVWVREAWQ